MAHFTRCSQCIWRWGLYGEGWLPGSHPSLACQTFLISFVPSSLSPLLLQHEWCVSGLRGSGSFRTPAPHSRCPCCFSPPWSLLFRKVGLDHLCSGPGPLGLSLASESGNQVRMIRSAGQGTTCCRSTRRGGVEHAQRAAWPWEALVDVAAGVSPHWVKFWCPLCSVAVLSVYLSAAAAWSGAPTPGHPCRTAAAWPPQPSLS